MLKDRRKDAVSAFPWETLCHHVDRFCRILGENRDAVFPANEFGYPFMCVPVPLGCDSREPVYPLPTFER